MLQRSLLAMGARFRDGIQRTSFWFALQRPAEAAEGVAFLADRCLVLCANLLYLDPHERREGPTFVTYNYTHVGFN